MQASEPSLHHRATAPLTPHQQPLPTGPIGLTKQRPALAQLREAMTALHVGGVCRAVSYELLTYWSPGGTVFPSVETLADGVGLKPRMVRYHLKRLDRVGLWVRIGRTKDTNIYELHLPGEAQEGVTKPLRVQPIANQGCNPLHPQWSVKRSAAPSGRSAARSNVRAVRTERDRKPAPPLEAVASFPSLDEIQPPAGRELGPNGKQFLKSLAQFTKPRKRRRGRLDVPTPTPDPIDYGHEDLLENKGGPFPTTDLSHPGGAHPHRQSTTYDDAKRTEAGNPKHG